MQPNVTRLITFKLAADFLTNYYSRAVSAIVDD
jgi:hypothetical protein